MNDKRTTWEHGRQPLESPTAQAVVIGCLILASVALAGLATGILEAIAR
jgi:hypothetical protein